MAVTNEPIYYVSFRFICQKLSIWRYELAKSGRPGLHATNLTSETSEFK
jgi:hypothetical protein